jgi:hypothetical protein
MVTNEIQHLQFPLTMRSNKEEIIRGAGSDKGDYQLWEGSRPSMPYLGLGEARHTVNPPDRGVLSGVSCP